ncbi:MAG: GT4 family glycosyltransferase PelF [Bacillota bacterium]|nr:GT4 family glycosyltransferase PelF [Bacillota bacterium]
MKICIITEGSYPYMIGGITSWLNIFLKCFTDLQFVTFAIGAKEKDKGKYSCKIPDNMIHIKEIFLDTPVKKKVHWLSRHFIKDNREREALSNHFSGRYSDWPMLFEFIERIKGNNLIDFFNSSEFYEIVQDIYKTDFPNAPFNDFLWSIRTMYIYQFYVLSEDVPEADVYHCVSAGFPGIVASKMNYFKKKPFILTEHGIYTREREEEIIKTNLIMGYAKELWVKYFVSMSKCAYEFSQRIVTQFERNRSIQIGIGADIQKTLIIPNGMNVEDYNKTFDNKLYDDSIVLGAIARVVPIKDIITMVRSFKLAKKEVPALKLVIMGPTNEDEEYFEYVLDYIKKENICDVVFTKRVDYNTYLHTLFSMDIVILTSISEGQPLSILEAMAYSKPIIVTDVGCCSELVYGASQGQDRAGILVPVMDSTAIAKAIVHLALDESMRKRMGEVGKQRVSKYYTIKNMQAEYKKVYEEALS